jgi:hypothetical protein
VQPLAEFAGSYTTLSGGHQTTWAVDGVEIPNTNIASNLGPQIDPKDIDYREVQRGSYEADQGHRTYGVFNVTPRTGFEGTNKVELIGGSARSAPKRCSQSHRRRTDPGLEAHDSIPTILELGPSPSRLLESGCPGDCYSGNRRRSGYCPAVSAGWSVRSTTGSATKARTGEDRFPRTAQSDAVP